MRVLTEQMKGKKVDTLDGIKVFEKRGWAQVLPDVVHFASFGAATLACAMFLPAAAPAAKKRGWR